VYIQHKQNSTGNTGVLIFCETQETVHQHNDGLTSLLSPPVLRRWDLAFCG